MIEQGERKSGYAIAAVANTSLFSGLYSANETAFE